MYVIQHEQRSKTQCLVKKVPCRLLEHSIISEYFLNIQYYTHVNKNYLENYFPEVEKHDVKFTSLTQERVGGKWAQSGIKGNEHYMLCFVYFTLKKHETRLTKQNLYRCENPRAIQFL